MEVGGRRWAYSVVACLGRLTIDNASLSRRGTVCVTQLQHFSAHCVFSINYIKKLYTGGETILKSGFYVNRRGTSAVRSRDSSKLVFASGV